MQKVIRYAVFRTKWGYFGLAGTEKALLRTHLPLPEPQNLKHRLLEGLPAPQYDKNLFNTLQKQIIAYFEGTYVNFDPNIPIVLDGFSTFAGRVLTACRKIRFSQTISYGQLAQKIRRPAAARAVGRVMASNPLPLIIPCHRVIRSPCLRRGKLVPAQAGIGGFSAQGGTKLKNKLLQFEGHCERSEAILRMFRPQHRLPPPLFSSPIRPPRLGQVLSKNSAGTFSIRYSTVAISGAKRPVQ